MNAAAALAAGVLAAVLGLLVPRLIATVPEPTPREGDTDSPDEEVKALYADIGAAPGLALRAAVVSGAAAALLGATLGWDWSLVWLIPLVPVCVALSVIDWHTRLLPSVVVIPATLATLAAVVVVGLLSDQQPSMTRAVIGMLVVRTFFWLLWFLRSAGMGFGDVRLSALVGLVLGWLGWGPLLIGVWIGFLAFSLPGLALAVVRRDRSLLRKPFPYGPFMVAGALVGLLWGPTVSGWLWG